VLKNEDFNEDNKDAGDVGAGHNVTALYEIGPAGVEVPGGKVNDLKYQHEAGPAGLRRAAHRHDRRRKPRDAVARPVGCDARIGVCLSGRWPVAGL
jgi:hypothetical protein